MASLPHLMSPSHSSGPEWLGPPVWSQRCKHGASAHYVMVSKTQWKTFWLATQHCPQNGLAGWLFRVDYDVFRHTSPLTGKETDQKIEIGIKAPKPLFLKAQQPMSSFRSLYKSFTGCKSRIFRMHFILGCFICGGFRTKIKMLTKSSKQAKESAVVSGCLKISCVRKVGGSQHTKI